MAEKPKPTLHLIGLLPNPQWLPPAVAALIEEADVIGAGDRLLKLFPGAKADKLRLSLPIEGWLKELKALQRKGKKVVVLASGDPNHYGLAQKLLNVIGPESVTIIPAPTLVQQAFARLKTSWAHTEVVSLHGRESQTALWSALFRASHYSGSGFVAIYTDADNTPTVIAKRLLGRGQHNWRMIVFEDLGTQDERCTTWTLFDAKLRKFSPLNLVVLECLERPAHIYLGMPENAFSHEAGLITKLEIRVVALGLLELQPDHLLWDLGAGSGSISIEAASLLPHGSVWAVEKSPLRSEQIAANRAFFGATQVEVVEDDSLAAMNHLPPPDRVFIGGGGEALPRIIKTAKNKLRPQGLILANAVSLDSLNLAAKAIKEAGLELSVTQIQAARSEPLSDSLMLKPLNQVWLVRGKSQ
ncbi:MAG: precorrin-6y C5,15-methyltransferase (decarboxylating) subunit CbiE [Candidatus Adiutrix sp.]|jgi:precorrin-6Y C5,15-methyltransferase (decarboxylating)|nr:precorrin-6y C5,15-methyltransferase (decarboxylating) subunit CbiE [Candidatus Adiutrix sp.]